MDKKSWFEETKAVSGVFNSCLADGDQEESKFRYLLRMLSGEVVEKVFFRQRRKINYVITHDKYVPGGDSS